MVSQTHNRLRQLGRRLIGLSLFWAVTAASVGAVAQELSAPSYLSRKMTGHTRDNVVTAHAHAMASGGSTGPVRPAVQTVADLLYQDAATAARIAAMIEGLAPGTTREHIYEIAQSLARWTRVYGVRPELMVGLINHESGFRPSARSRTNDHGLCQLHGRPIYEIDANVRAGVAHFVGNLAAEGGDEFRALCRYNGGPGGVNYPVCQRYARTVLDLADRAAATTTRLRPAVVPPAAPPHAAPVAAGPHRLVGGM